MRLWRISEFPALDGRGGLIAGGRWHSRGRPVVYLAEHSALAMLEVRVHLEVATVPPSFRLIEVDAPDDLAVTEHGWPAPDEAGCRAWGDAWLAAGETPLARVPSVVAPRGWNMLLNPLHGEAGRCAIVRDERWPWDGRLWPSAASA